jgi:predicted RNase H-like HicB family nuclease
MRYRIVREHDSETRSYTATVPGLPIVIDANSEEEAVKLAKEAIAWYREEAGASRSAPAEPPVEVKIVTVDV